MRKTATFLIHLLIAICFVLPSFAEAASSCEPACLSFSEAPHHPEASCESACDPPSKESPSHENCDCFLHHGCVSHFTLAPSTSHFARLQAPSADTLASIATEPALSAYLAGPFQPPRA